MRSGTAYFEMIPRAGVIEREGADGVGIVGRALLEDDQREGTLAPLLVGHADHRHLAHRRVLGR